MSSDNYNFVDDSIINRKLADSDLQGDYKKVYNFLAGALDGASFYGNGECKTALNGIAYYGLDMFQNRQAYNPTKTFKFGFASQKFTEKASTFWT